MHEELKIFFGSVDTKS